MRVVRGQDLGERSGGFFRLLGLLRVDDGDQKILKLREELFEGISARCRHGRLAANISSVSVVMPRWPAAYQPEKMARTAPARITDRA